MIKRQLFSTTKLQITTAVEEKEEEEDIFLLNYDDEDT
jgi:hypothetical protein